MARFLFLWSTSEAPPSVVEPPNGHLIDVLDQYRLPDLSAAELAGYDGLLLESHADQRVLMAQRARLDTFLDTGSLLVNATVVDPFLPEFGERFIPIERQSVANLEISILAEHPVFDGVTEHDLTFRHGVAGFWGLGYQPQPANATPLTGIGSDRAPFDWIVERPGGGRLFVHPGNDIWGFTQFDTTAARVWPQLLDWLGDCS